MAHREERRRSADSRARATTRCASRWPAAPAAATIARSMGSKGSSSQASAAASTRATRPRRYVRERHPVLGERAGLVHAQHRRRAERFDRRHAPREHAVARDAPGAEREEHRQHHRELLGQDRHRQRQAGEDAGQPVAARQPVVARTAASDSSTAKVATTRTMRAVSRSRRVFSGCERGERSADAARARCARPVATTSARPCPFTTSVAEIHRVARALFHRQRLAGEQRLVQQSDRWPPPAARPRAPGRLRPAAAGRRAPPRAPAMRCTAPSRTTSARGLDRSRSASSARSALRSCTTVIAHHRHDRGGEHQRLVQVAEQQVDAGRGDQQRGTSARAARRARSPRRCAGRGDGSAFGPSAARRRAASAALKPPGSAELRPAATAHSLVFGSLLPARAGKNCCDALISSR